MDPDMALPHPALALGSDAMAARCCPTYSLQRAERALPALSPRRVLLAQVPLASPLPSTASAAGCAALFGAFIGTTRLSDFLGSFIVGVRPWTSRRGPPLQRRANPGTSRFSCEVFPYLHGVYDRARPGCISRWLCSRCGLPPCPTTSASRRSALSR